MFYAWNEDKTDATLAPGARGICPQCGSPVLAKCGELNTWHWAHQATQDCDSWSEPEGPWHKAWKELFPREWREITIKKPHVGIHSHAYFTANPPPEWKDVICEVIGVDQGGLLVLKHPSDNIHCISVFPNWLTPVEKNSVHHRADVQTKNGVVIEFQNSPLSPTEIAAREYFYGRMVWVFNATQWADRITISFLEDDQGITLSDLASMNYYSQLAKILEARDKLAEQVSGFTGCSVPSFTANIHIGRCVDRNILSVEKACRTREVRFKWSHPRTSLLSCKKAVFWDFGNPAILLFSPSGFSHPPIGKNCFSGYFVPKGDALEALTG